MNAFDFSPEGLKKAREVLEKDIVAIEAKVRPLRDKATKLEAKIEPLNEELRAVYAEIKAIERPEKGVKLADLKNGIAAVARALGSRTLPPVDHDAETAAAAKSNETDKK